MGIKGYFHRGMWGGIHFFYVPCAQLIIRADDKGKVSYRICIR